MRSRPESVTSLSPMNKLSFLSEAENVTVGGWNFGGTPISVRFQSPDYAQLMKAKDLMKDELKKISGVKDIRDDTPLGANEFIVDLKRDFLPRSTDDTTNRPG